MSTVTPAKPESIAVVIGQLGPGGSERQLYFFLRHCDRSRWSPRVYVSSLILGDWADQLRDMEIPITLLHGSRLDKFRQLRAGCIAQGAKCFFSWSSYTNPFGLALTGLGIRRVGSFRNASFADLPTRLRKAWSYLSVSGVSTIVCNSRETYADIAARYGGKKRVVYVPNAVDIFSPEQERVWREEWRSRLGLDDDSILIVGAGRLAPQKNFARFIDVVAEVSKKAPVRAAIAGLDFGCLADLEARVARLGLTDKIKFLGRLSDARELMPAADIFLLSSDHEGMPNVVLESMASGTPCVSTNVNGIGELIVQGVNGFIGTNDVLDLSGYVLQLVEDRELRRSIGARARSSIERFGPTRVVPELWRVCEAEEERSPARQTSVSDISARAE